MFGRVLVLWCVDMRMRGVASNKLASIINGGGKRAVVGDVGTLSACRSKLLEAGTTRRQQTSPQLLDRLRVTIHGRPAQRGDVHVKMRREGM